MDTHTVKLLIESHGYHVSIHQLGDYVELHAFRWDATTDVGDGMAVPSELKIVRTEGTTLQCTAVAMTELAGMCGIELSP